MSRAFLYARGLRRDARSRRHNRPRADHGLTRCCPTPSAGRSCIRELQANAGERRSASARTTSNLFRDRNAARKRRLDVGTLQSRSRGRRRRTAGSTSKGMTPYDALVDATLRARRDAGVVPQLKVDHHRRRGSGRRHRSLLVQATGWCTRRCSSSRCCWATAASSLCTPDNEHRDLFFGFPNSYGTLGYALRLKARAVPVKRYVAAHAHPPQRRRRLLPPARRSCASGDVDFIDGTVFAADELYHHGRTLRRRGPVRQRLHVRAHLLPLDPRRARPTT